MDKFTLLNGELLISTNEIIIKKKNKYYVKGSWLSIIFMIIFIKLFKNTTFNSQIEVIKQYIGYGVFIVVLLFFLFLIIFFIFFYNWKNTIEIVSISKIEINKKNELETDVTLITSNNRQKFLEFRNLENQLNPFIEKLKSKNSRIKIKYV